MSNGEQKMMMPIAIDLGAKHTAVYSVCYEAGATLDKIKDEDKQGKVYHLEKDAYTLLMVNRTATRHQRRCFDRRQMAKRLFKLIWKEHLQLEWDKDVQQTISFLMNRRGFSFLTEEYDADILSQFPDEAYEKLPEELQGEVEEKDDGYDFASALTEWSKDNKKIGALYEAINKEPKRISQRQVSIGRTEKLREYCVLRTQGETIKEKDKERVSLSKLSKWILDEWRENSDLSYLLPATEKYTFDMVGWLNKQNQGTAGQIMEKLPDTSQEAENHKKNPWKFKPENFKLEKADFGDAENPDISTHLRHLAFALHKVNEELTSGGRHRSKYLTGVGEILGHPDHTHGYLKRFCANLQTAQFKSLNAKHLINLIGHISNLELKPLRKYFNDEKHKQGDFWCEKRLADYFSNWLLNEWRINPEKDKDKTAGKKGDYKELRKLWQERKSDIIGFWCTTDPFYTIPPYQDNNNRRPPKCQSLILNPKCLNDKYPDWQQWLEQLKALESVKTYLDNFEQELKDLKSGKGKGYFDAPKKGIRKTDSGKREQKDLDARVLQFIFDRVKASDPLDLNEIYSQTKKIRQNGEDTKAIEAAKKALEKALDESKLSEELQTKPYYTGTDEEEVFSQGTFLHLACKYYKLRQRARDGRLFIHPEYHPSKTRGYENTGRFDDKGCLLTYCNHKPRQKRYQLLNDLAGVLQVSPRQLTKVVGSQKEEDIISWLNKIDYLKRNCKRATKEQKDRRGSLKIDIQNVFGLIYHHKKSDVSTDTLQESKVKDAGEFHSFCVRARELCLVITKNLYNIGEQKRWHDDLENNPATAVYMLAQINNIAFKERSGNAKTCAVCSADNAQRMQMIASQDGSDSHAKSQRLPAIETRQFDGAVMRMARILSTAIVKDNWDKVETELNQGKKVSIPIITESNRFEFEPSKEELVKSQRTKARKGKSTKREDDPDWDKDEEGIKLGKSKDERIETAGHGICPYTGNPVSDDGQRDHIIPQSSKWGTLNDEANLIWVNEKGNQEKGKQIFSLSKLCPNYKKELFPGKNNEQIKEWIIDQIDDGESEDFKFGKYRSFINLTQDEQKAFRHALFLVGHPLRNKVIAAIDNRTRTLVNGTQRYFAETLANAFYKKAKEIKKNNNISFDYFGVEAWDNSRGIGIRDLRTAYEVWSREPSRTAYEESIKDLFKAPKQKGQKQDIYSHLLDAQIAFCIAANAHKKEGSLKLSIDDSIQLWPPSKDEGLDKDTSEIQQDKEDKIHDSRLFDQIHIKPKCMEKPTISRRDSYTVETHHREWLKKERNKKISINYQIHRDSIIKENFFPLLQLKKDKSWKKGFNCKNSVPYKEKDSILLKDKGYLTLEKETDNYDVYLVDKNNAQNFLMSVGRTKKDKEDKGIAKLLDSLTYKTIKKPIQDVLSATSKESKEILRKSNHNGDENIDKLSKVLENKEKTLKEVLEVWQYFIKKENFMKDKILLPFHYEWEKLRQEIENEENKEIFLHTFLKKSNLFKKKKSEDEEDKGKPPHQKTKKVYSLPIKSTIGNIRLRRKSWTGEPIIQIVAEKSLAKYGLDGNQRPHTILSKNSTPIGHYTGLPSPSELESQPRRWVEIPNREIKVITIKKAKLRHKDAGRCLVKIWVDNIENLSIPKDINRWKGKIICHSTKAEKDEAVSENKKNNKYHCLEENFEWFPSPFTLPKDRREVELKKEEDNTWVIEFTISSKTKKVKNWLLTPN